jgi:hypothetical protein
MTWLPPRGLLDKPPVTRTELVEAARSERSERSNQGPKHPRHIALPTVTQA